MRKTTYFRHTTAYLLVTVFLVIACLTGCGQDIPDTPSDVDPSNPPTQGSTASFGTSSEDAVNSTALWEDSEKVPSSATLPADSDEENVSLPDRSPVCLVPSADGTAENHNDVASIDYSNASSGYVMAKYSGTCPKVKLRITCPDQIVYTYDLHGNGYETFPLSSGNGNYKVTVYENISGTDYVTCLFSEIAVQLTDEFSPFLYPNQYVNFNAESKTVAKGAELAAGATSDLDVVVNVYDYIISSIEYDHNKASDPPVGYTSDVDAILESGTGICLDYAAVMTAMLRSQQIPTRLEVGYAKDAYHAWISIHIEDVGWLNGIIEFDGKNWTLVDPTLGASTGDKSLKKFIGDGSNYLLQKVY